MVTTSTSTEPPATSLSLREKCAWTNLGTTVAVYVPYFAYVGLLLGRGELRISTVLPPLLGAVVAQVALSILAFSLFAVPARREPKDERDLALEGRSLRGSYRVLVSLGFTLLVLAPAFCFGPLTAGNDPGFVVLLAAQGFLLCFVLAEVVRFAVLAVGYRRGF